MIRTRQRTVGRDIERLLRDGILPAERDTYLLERYVVDRDEAAFEAIVARHGPLVLSLCRRYLRDPRDVEDAFQATFLILARKGRALRDRASLSSWLYGVAHRVALRARADVLKRREREGGSDLGSEPAAPSTKPLDDSLEALDHELSRLPEKYRAPLVLCYLKGRTHDQAAGELGWPVGTVRSRMARARAILRKRLARRGLDATTSLAIPRLELLSSSSLGMVPESLIRATVAVASRYAGAATATGAVASLSSASSSWPAKALAQGVLTTMMFSQLKLVGLGTAAVGLLAGALGAGALAVNASDGPEDPARPAVETQAKEVKRSLQPTPLDRAGDADSRSSDVEARLRDMERRFYRLLELLDERVGAISIAEIEESSSSLPPMRFPPDPSPITPASRPRPSTAEPTLPPRPSVESPEPPPLEPDLPTPPETRAGDSPRDLDNSLDPEDVMTLPPGFQGVIGRPAEEIRSAPRPSADALGLRNAPAFMGSTTPYNPRGVREIEAQLINAHLRYKRVEELFNKGVVSSEELERAVESARILVAQLKEMRDEMETAAQEARDARSMFEDYRKEFDLAHTEFEDVRDRVYGDTRKAGDPKEQAKLDDYKSRLGNLRRQVDESLREARKLENERKRLARRQGQVDKLIEWAEGHFKGLAIDDPPLK